MSISTTLKALVDPLIAGGCHRGVNRDTTIIVPYAIIYQVAATPIENIHSTSTTSRERYQLDVFAHSPEQAEGLALGTIKTAVEGALGDLIFRHDGQYNDFDKTFQYITEYVIWDT